MKLMKKLTKVRKVELAEALARVSVLRAAKRCAGCDGDTCTERDTTLAGDPVENEVCQDCGMVQ